MFCAFVPNHPTTCFLATRSIYKGSYICAHVLLNLLNELGKVIKMRGKRGLPSILSLFRNEFNQFNNTSARMLDSIDHITLKLLKSRIFGVKASRFCHLFQSVITDVITLLYLICKPLVVYLFHCMALYHSQARRHVINCINLLEI